MLALALVGTLAAQVRTKVGSAGVEENAEVVVRHAGLEVAQAGRSLVEAAPAAGKPELDRGPDRTAVRDHCARNWGWTTRIRAAFRSEDNAVPPKWDTGDTELHYGEYEIPKSDGDFEELKKYFFRFMPKSTRLRKISMIANPALWAQYNGKVDALQVANRTTYSNPCEVEKWLWHGTGLATLPLLLRTGFKTAYASMEYNVYGAGLYFAPDPRLAHYFVEDNRGKTGVVSKLILVRVAAGKTGEREALGWSGTAKAEWLRKLTLPANRQAPAGFDSATSDAHTEVITYQDNTAYPAYVFEYTADALRDVDPYADKSFKDMLGVIEDVSQDPLCSCPASTNPL